MKKHLYEVTFQFKRGSWFRRLIHIEADNIPEAKQIARDLWYAAYDPRMFNLTARRVAPDELIDFAHWFVKC